MRWGSFLEDVFSYEPDFFGISEHEAPWVDPQHRLLLEVAWEACEHAGIPPTSLAGERVGTFFGLYSRDYLLRSPSVRWRTPTRTPSTAGPTAWPPDGWPSC